MLILTEKNISSIVSYMLNFEYGYTVYDEELNIKSDLLKFPIIPLPDGRKIHYKPTCGIIFYNVTDFATPLPDIETNLLNFIHSIYEIISQYEEHLLKERITATTGSCVIKKNKFINGTYLLKAQKPFMYTKKDIEQFPARIITALPITFDILSKFSLPPNYSTRASFMWYFIPMQFENIKKSTNSLISSIYLDFRNITVFNNRDITYNISYKDIKNLNIIFNKTYHRSSFFIKKIIDEESHISYKIYNISLSEFNSYKYFILSIIRDSSADRIRQFNYFKYVNGNKKCINCELCIFDIGFAVPIIDCCESNESPPDLENTFASLFCIHCWCIQNKVPNLFYIVCKESYNIEELYPDVYSIDYDNFKKLISNTIELKKEFQTLIDSFLNKNPKKIILTYKSITYIINNITIDLSENILYIIKSILY